jgi:hypothetical protein
VTGLVSASLLAILAATGASRADPALLGIALGQKLTIEDCRLRLSATAPCARFGERRQLADGEMSIPGAMPADPLDTGFSTGKFRIGLLDDKVCRLDIVTQGEQVQDRIGVALERTFGRPASSDMIYVRTASGATVPNRREFWQLPGLTVKFDGIDGGADSGSILLRSDACARLEDQGPRQ